MFDFLFINSMWWFVLRGHKIHLHFYQTDQVYEIFLMEGKYLLMQRSQYHGCWWPVSLCYQGINSMYWYNSPTIFQPQHWFNIKMSSYQYRKSHCGDKTVVRSSYLHNGISYTGKMASLYWFSLQNELNSLSSKTLCRESNARSAGRNVLLGYIIVWNHH